MVGHGSYCGGAYRSGSGAMFGDMKKMPHAKPDLENVEFCIFVGTAPGNAGNPFKRQGTLLAKARASGTGDRLHYAIALQTLDASATKQFALYAAGGDVRLGSEAAKGEV